MNKKTIFENLKTEIDLQLKYAIEATKSSIEMATHEDSKAENKYDTRGLEASYLARAQSERVIDLKTLRNGLDSLKIRNFENNHPIALTALIQLESKETVHWFLLLPHGGGQSFKHQDKIIKVITPESPLGSRLIGKTLDDIIELKNNEYHILSVL